MFKVVGIPQSRKFRNDLNENFNVTNQELQRQEKRITKLIQDTPQPSEIVDARGEHATVGERLDITDEKIQSVSKYFVDGSRVEIDLFPYRGANISSIVPGQFSSTRYDELITVAKNANMNSITIVCTWYMDTKTSSTIYRDSSKTIEDAEVITAIRKAKAAELKVMLKPHVDVLDGTFRGEIKPYDPVVWFDSYRAFIANYTSIAEKENVELFCIGTELKSMTTTTYTSQWITTINAIRVMFNNDMTYAANATFIAPNEEYAQIEFWSYLDYAGLDVYLKLTKTFNPAQYDVARGWTSSAEGADVLKELEKWRKTHGKPVLFTEIGCTNYNGCTQDPAKTDWKPLEINNKEQSQFVESIFQIWTSKKWLHGFFWWRLSFNKDDAFTVEEREAVLAFEKWSELT
ncbi:glycoside hydrolase family 113 [Bacillus cereus]|uniref:glycoside hydrolase family 113 n=1 Tax=Bacillus cereus TaxID=1396 RepID=UPI00201BFE72|nr:cellulase family glycosylhydrolase [Bacillus cereus]